MTPAERAARAKLLEDLEQARTSYRTALLGISDLAPWSGEEAELSTRASRLLARVTELERTYFERLPLLPLSRCPLDGAPLLRHFDAAGFDGSWWRSDACPQDPPACDHFWLVTGAVRLSGSPQGGEFDAHLGPAVPYVVPRLLQRPGVTAVLQSIPMEQSGTAYTVAYFAERRPEHEPGSSEWRRTHVAWVDGREARWRIDQDPRDFELEPWIESGRLRWIAPGTGELIAGKTSDCPFLRLEGERRPRVLRADRLRVALAPTERVLPPFTLG
jgi:hypothetical protein